jgi:hypothetical protein
MSDEKPEYLVGDKGVQLTSTPLHTPDGGLLNAQNCEFIRIQGLGGIGSRPGMARLNASAAAGAIVHVQNLPFAYPNDLVMMVATNAGETESWKKTTDGTTYTDIQPATLERMVAIDKFSGVSVHGGIVFLPRRTITYKRRFYFAGDNYVVDTSKPVLVSWDGTNAFEVFRLPNNPTQSGTVSRWIIDLWPANGFIYLSTWEFGGVAPDHKGRVIRFDPENGTLTLVGNRFGDGAGENLGGMPYCLTTFLGQLWAGTMGISGNPNGKVYRILEGVDETWTLDQTLGVDEGYLMSMLAYKGNLYLATSSDASGTAKVKKRTAAGVYSNSQTGPGVGQGYYGGLIEFNSELYACYFQSGVSCLIQKFDNASWVTDLNVGTNILTSTTAHAPGQPFVFGNALYWPFFDPTNDSALTNFLLKRTTAGVWSKVLTAVGVRGGLGVYRPDAS